ncbi:MAG TPA: Gfo/Idh/MocA family oxidoreductase, partial [Saprospiraceae bacterium]|nr:Gfo/Idh/MocA family oxidoreductase [Saprospiraceae bacterium]
MKRRDFVKQGTIIGAGVSLLQSNLSLNSNINVGIIGVGARGLGHLDLLLRRTDVNVTAICDINEFTLKSAASLVSKLNKTQPKVYKGSESAYKDLINDKNVDAVVIATPWHWHVPMAVDAMHSKKAVGLEVSGSTSVEECRQLVRAYESTKTPIMFLENVCYRRDILAILNMVRKDVFGELVHLQGGY